MRRLVVLAVMLVPSVVHAEDYTPPCTDDEVIVGVRQCPPYGEWARNLVEPYVFVDLGANFRHFAAAPVRTLARSTAPTEPARASEAVTFNERVGYRLTPHVYLALDIELGNLRPDDSGSQHHDVIIAGLGEAGLRGSIHFATLGFELAAGGMEYSDPTDPDLRHAGMVELRGRADLWLSPWWSVGGLVGQSVLERGNWVAGLYIGFHTHAYAGDR